MEFQSKLKWMAIMMTIHTDGLEGPSSFLSIYERAYGKFLGDEEMKNEMKSKKPLKTGSPWVPGPAGKTSNKLAKVS